MKLSVSFLMIEEDKKQNIELLASLPIDYLHLDIMDGKFVSNENGKIEEIQKIISYEKPLDVHLMVENVKEYVDNFAILKPEYITFHYETDQDIMENILYIKEKDCKVGLALKPKTPSECLFPYLPFIDMVLIMSVEPGYGGQEFLEETINKLDKLEEIRMNYHYSFLIEVDGGINDKTIAFVKKADILVVGSYITNGNYIEQIQKLK